MTPHFVQPGLLYKQSDFDRMKAGVNQPVISSAARGNVRPIWELVYNHYTKRKGLAAPYCKRFAEKIRPEDGGGNYGPGSGGYDQLGYGTLTATLDPIN